MGWIGMIFLTGVPFVFTCCCCSCVSHEFKTGGPVAGLFALKLNRLIAAATSGEVLRSALMSFTAAWSCNSFSSCSTVLIAGDLGVLALANLKRLSRFGPPDRGGS